MMSDKYVLASGDESVNVGIAAAPGASKLFHSDGSRHVKITELRTLPLSLPLEKPIGNATATIHSFSCLAIFLDTDEGVTGENLIFTIRPEQLPLLDSMVKLLREAVIGREPDETEAFWAEAWRRINFIGFAGVSIMGIAAIDGAMWDLRGRAAGLCISKLVGRARDAVPAYASGGLWLTQSVSELVAEAEAFLDRGFTAMKLRLAGRAEIDLPRLKALREAVGGKVALMVDANQGMTAKDAIALGREMEAFDIAWFEEPLPAHDLEHLAEVRVALQTPIASGENEYTRYGFRRMIEAKAADILMPDLQRVGGVSEFLKVGALAAAHDLPVSSHLFPEMSLQIMGSLPNATLLEHLEWFSPLYQEPMEFKDGMALVPDRPGWGFTFDQKALEHHKI
ncbi:mandelate racemase/muconate lactonizing enzyme family protein [Chelativorans sp. AA-79]|uniref:mandelate racemase/muconate lactonizing enzyme family protein n=1 Tax=Chelativorans sp. AA-79 TaxID=3028735 RepID=UPI0023F96AE5|nr:mandelate racemase/muconate lactonizing enzyme family protein [Chelativorans sp. AA-79]WEX11102.1 mandelate racemase/muconate lactonizing enzyme family protein [Chelativorans sp. AA-79]